ncbi:hypothetical protein [Staphylococcus phage vB_StaM_SA1]|nr:hypothetical protein [Staphylococcus phage vB_StaM_SA1]
MNKDNVSEKKEKSFMEKFNRNIGSGSYVVRDDFEDFKNKHILSNYDKI